MDKSAPHRSAAAIPTAESATQTAANLRGIILVIVGMGAFALNDTLTKATSSELPIGQILVLRGLFGCILLLPIMAFTVKLMHIPRLWSFPMLIRSVSEVFAAILFFNALFRLPIASVTAILQLLPLTLTAAAAILLKETVGWRRWSAAAVGFLGILLVIRPGSDGFSWWYLCAFCCVLFVTARDIAMRYVYGSIPSVLITFITSFTVMLSGCVVGLFEVWVTPSLNAVCNLGAAAVLVLIGYYSLIECWRGVAISVVAPFRYSVVLWAMAFGYLMLGEIPNTWAIAGSAVVVAAGVYTLHREQVSNR